MRITIANVKGDKPRTKLERDIYFKNLQFHSETILPEDFESIVGKGYTISYTYKDNTFYRKGDYTKDNYIGTDYIVIDVDSITIDPETFISGIKYKPTLYHTTFSNLTSYKDYKYCYHLVYCLDEFITGEDNFMTFFYLLSKDYWEKVDKKAKDCHRCIFTSNSELPNYQYGYLGHIYSPSELLKDVDLNTIKLEVEKAYSVNKNSKIKDKKQLEDKFSLDKDFYNDLYSSSWEEIIVKYSTNFKFWISTKIDPSRYQNGYVDLRNEEYYTVPSWKLIYDKKEGKAIIPKVKNGHRNNMLWQDALAFMAIIPDITKENLVYCLIRTVYHHYDYEYNSDRITTTDIIQKAREAWNGKYTKNPTKKKFKINTIEYKKQGRTDWIKISNEIRMDMKDNDFGSLYDFNASVEDNLKVFHEQGLKTKKNTLIKWLKDKGYDYFTEKDKRNKLVIELYKDNPNRSYREIEKLCKERGIKVKDKTISTIINKCVKIDSTSILSEDSCSIYRSTVKNYAVSNNNKNNNINKCVKIDSTSILSERNNCIYRSTVKNYAVSEDKEKEDNNDIKDKDKEYMNKDIEDKYRWIVEVYDRIEHDEVIQKYRKINMDKKQNITDSSSAKENDIKDKEKEFIKVDYKIPQQQNRSKQEELNELKNKLTLDGITTDFLGIHNYTKDIDVRMISSNNQDSFESMFI